MLNDSSYSLVLFLAVLLRLFYLLMGEKKPYGISSDGYLGIYLNLWDWGVSSFKFLADDFRHKFSFITPDYLLLTLFGFFRASPEGELKESFSVSVLSLSELNSCKGMCTVPLSGFWFDVAVWIYLLFRTLVATFSAAKLKLASDWLSGSALT